MKLLREETESAALALWSSTSGLVRVSSSLAVVEVGRAMTTLSERATADALITTLTLVPVTDAVLRLAATLPPARLRSLDAIHLATALRLQPDLTALVAYDDRLLEAATALGLPVASPGR